MFYVADLHSSVRFTQRLERCTERSLLLE